MTGATQLDQTSGDQRITLNETAVPSTASYDTAVEFLRNSCYGSRHGRESGMYQCMTNYTKTTIVATCTYVKGHTEHQNGYSSFATVLQIPNKLYIGKSHKTLTA